MKALILAAGLGTRLKPITDSIPKALVPVNGVPLLEYHLKQLSKQGITEFIINVHHFADSVLEFLDKNKNFGLNITISDEKEKLLDTGGAIKKAAWFFADDRPFLVYNVDIISTVNIQALFNYHIARKPLATLVVNGRESSRYFLFDCHNRLCGWKNMSTQEEKIPAPASILTPLAFGGIHIISPQLLEHLESFDDKFSIVDVYLHLVEKEQHIMAYHAKYDKLIDAGKPDSLKEAENLIKQFPLLQV